MVTAVICHAAMTGWITKIIGGVTRKIERIGYNSQSWYDRFPMLPERLRWGYWPDHAHPKCLYHRRGERVLDRTIRILRLFHVDHVRFVAGYRINTVRQYNKAMGFGMEVLYNPTWGNYYRSQESMLVGLEGVDDDVIVLVGDVFLTGDLMAEIMYSSNPLTMSAGHIYKMDGEEQGLLKELPLQEGGFAEIEVPLMILFRRYNAYEAKVTTDLDYYSQTDEYQRKLCQYLYAEGWSFDEISRTGLNLSREWVEVFCTERYPRL